MQDAPAPASPGVATEAMSDGKLDSQVCTAADLCREWLKGREMADGRVKAPAKQMLKAGPEQYPEFFKWKKSPAGRKFFSYRQALMDMIEAEARRLTDSVRGIDHDKACETAASRLDEQMKDEGGKRLGIQDFIQRHRKRQKAS